VEWSKLHTDELHYLYYSPNIIRAIKSKRIGWAEHVERMGERRGIQDFCGEPEEKRLVGSLRRRWEDNIKMDL
jgi:hypothetical protein